MTYEQRKAALSEVITGSPDVKPTIAMLRKYADDFRAKNPLFNTGLGTSSILSLKHMTAEEAAWMIALDCFDTEKLTDLARVESGNARTLLETTLFDLSKATPFELKTTSRLRMGPQDSASAGVEQAGKKVRNSCLSGHMPGAKCIYCSDAALNRLVLGDWQTTPTIEQLQTYLATHEPESIVVGNMTFPEYLRALMSGAELPDHFMVGWHLSLVSNDDLNAIAATFPKGSKLTNMFGDRDVVINIAPPEEVDVNRADIIYEPEPASLGLDDLGGVKSLSEDDIQQRFAKMLSTKHQRKMFKVPPEVKVVPKPSGLLRSLLKRAK